MLRLEAEKWIIFNMSNIANWKEKNYLRWLFQLTKNSKQFFAILAQIKFLVKFQTLFDNL